MPYVMLDTSVALPATLSPRGMARKLWVLLALGSLTYEAEHRALELTELRREAAATGGRLGGLTTAERLVEDAAERRAALLEHLPVGTPDDWVAVGSRPLFDEYERKLREVGSRFGVNVDDHDEIKRLRRQMEAICVAAAGPFDPMSAPALTRDPADDPIVLGALLADADYLISDDRHIVPDRESHHYEHDDRRVIATTFHYFVSEVFDDVAWGEIDGSLLTEAFAPEALEEDLW